MHTIGIDFGTTKTLVSHINPRTGQPEPLRLGRETHLLPTTIYIDANGHYYFGDDADDMIEEATGCYIRGFKMKLGSDAPMHLLPDGSRIFARDLVREYLHFIRKKVEKLVYHGEQITKATITRPVKFSPAQCMELEQAAKVAGFQQVEFTTEPEAAGLAYCRLNASHAFTRNALVVDWGGGTLDFALVTRHEGTVRTHANLTDGDTSMGGEKFDTLLWNYVEQAAMRLNVDYLDYVTQLPRVRRAKEVLSTQQNFTLRLSSAAGACPPIPLSRGEFNKLIEADVTKAAEKVQALIQRIPVELKPEMLLLVGGSSQIPLIKEQLEEVCHLPAMRWQYSREAVALGAALYKQPLSITCSICQNKVLISNGHGECAKCQMEYTTNAAGNAQVAGLQIRCSICQNTLTTTSKEATCNNCGLKIHWSPERKRWILIKNSKSDQTSSTKKNSAQKNSYAHNPRSQNSSQKQSTASSHKKVPAHNQPGNPANQKKDEEKSNDSSGCIITAVVIIVVWIFLAATELLGPVVAIGAWIAVIWGIIYLITKKK